MSERKHGEYGPFHFFDSGAVAFVDDKDVADFHNAGLESLDIVSHAGNENDDGDVREPDDVDLVLAYSDSLNDNGVFARRIQNADDVSGRCGETAQVSSRGHAADVHAGIDA